MQKVLSIGALLLVLVGCAADSGWKVAYEQERASRQEQDSRIRNLERNLEAQQRQPPQPQQIPQPQSPQSQQSPPPQWGQIRDQSMATCEELTRSQQVPIKCELFTLDSGTQLMSFTFADAQTLSRSWQLLTENLAGPYCITSNNLNIKAAIGQLVIKEDVVRMYYCQTAKWDEQKISDVQKYMNKRNQHY